MKVPLQTTLDTNSQLLANNNLNCLKEIKEYELKLKNDTYKLVIELKSDKRIIYFRMRQTNILSFYYYKNNFDYESITQVLFLLKEHYNDLSKILKFLDTSITRNKFELRQNTNKKE